MTTNSKDPPFAVLIYVVTFGIFGNFNIILASMRVK